MILRSQFEGAALVNEQSRPFVRTFATNTQNFLLSRPDMIGGRQRPRPVRVPEAGGILLRFYIGAGPYRGAAVTPYYGKSVHSTFTEVHMIRNSSDGQYHLWAEIVTPAVDAPQQTVDALVELFDYFYLYLK